MGERPKKIFFTPCPVEVLSHVAYHKGFLQKAVEAMGTQLLHISSLPPEEWDNHFTHRSPYFIRDGGNIPPIWTKSLGADTFVVALTFPHRKQVMLTRRNAFASVEDLAGKRLGIPLRKDEPIDFWRATLLRGSLSILKLHGLTTEDVTFVDIPVSAKYLGEQGDGHSIWSHRSEAGAFHYQEVRGLQDGLIDAVYTEGARVADIEKSQKFSVLYDLSNHGDLLQKTNICMPCVVTASGELVRNHPELVQAYVQALIQAAKWAVDSRDELLDIWSDELYLSRDCIEASFPPNVHQLLMPRMDQEGLQTLQDQIDFLFEHGFITSKFDLESWVRDDFIQQ